MYTEDVSANYSSLIQHLLQMRQYHSRQVIPSVQPLIVDTTTSHVHCKHILTVSTYRFLHNLTPQTSVILFQIHDLLWNSLEIAATLRTDTKLSSMAGSWAMSAPLSPFFTGEVPRTCFSREAHVARQIHVDGRGAFAAYVTNNHLNKDTTT